VVQNMCFPELMESRGRSVFRFPTVPISEFQFPTVPISTVAIFGTFVISDRPLMERF